MRFRLLARPLASNACHCTDCKRASGGTHAVFLHVRRAELDLLEGGVSYFQKTADSGRKIDIARCTSCGTRLWHEPLASPELLFVASGALDDGDWAIPTSHIFSRTMAPDVMPAPDALIIDGPPEDRKVLWARFAAIYSES